MREYAEITYEPRPVPELKKGVRLKVDYGPAASREYVVIGPGDDPGDLVVKDVTDKMHPHTDLVRLVSVQASIRSGFTSVIPADSSCQAAAD